ncbi:hypothetical protein BKM09_010105 [Pseudomonas amygdali pv. morsprunorum]|nr:hypothetical protein BKM19_027330 [Pseudomonas amygdali pv. morsprunorum]POP93599.1 hypothetical protein CXB39_12125 [Pseudomonas amygdali pv. morsprunorum]POY79181.1 hypothetical protein BKM09_010105 [Pseudomonas amygdali pv. morsprunorum]
MRRGASHDSRDAAWYAVRDALRRKRTRSVQNGVLTRSAGTPAGFSRVYSAKRDTMLLRSTARRDSSVLAALV